MIWGYGTKGFPENTIDCPLCLGEQVYTYDCSFCSGSGIARAGPPDADCPHCKGSSVGYAHLCPVCNGAGDINHVRAQYLVKYPRIMRELELEDKRAIERLAK